MKLILLSILIIVLLVLLYFLIKDITKEWEPIVVTIDDISDIYEKYDNIHSQQQKESKKMAMRKRNHRRRAEEYFHKPWIKDEENVHDSDIVKELAKKYARLDELVPDAPPPSANLDEDDWIDGLRSATSLEIKAFLKDTDALKALDKILESTSTIYSILENNEISEQDILCKVWMRIQDSEIEQDLKESLQHNLELAMSDSLNICPHGRMARLLSIFECCDSDPILNSPIKDEQIIRQEAFVKSYAVLQQELADKKMNILYNKLELNEREQTKLDKFKEDVKSKLSNILENDYAGLLESNKLKKLVGLCLEGI